MHKRARDSSDGFGLVFFVLAALFSKRFEVVLLAFRVSWPYAPRTTASPLFLVVNLDVVVSGGSGDADFHLAPLAFFFWLLFLSHYKCGIRASDLCLCLNR